MKINVNQIDSAGLTLAVQVASSGAAFSGNLVSYLAASGWIGPLAVTVTGNQDITGVKTFQISPIVPYSGSTGSAPSQLFVTDLVASLSGATVGSFINRGVSNDLISGNKFFTGAVQIGVPTATGHAVNQGYLTGVSGILSSSISGVSGALSSVRVTGSSGIQIANFTGIGGTLVFSSGNQIFISGGSSAGGGSSNTSVTGSSAISAPNFTGRGTVTLSYDGTYVNVSGVDTSGYFENNFVHRGLFNDQISGLKTFTGALGVGTPTDTGHAVNLGYLTGASGSLYARDIAISGVLQTAISAAGGGTVTNYSITGTGTINITNNASGNMINTYNNVDTVIIGQGFNMSFFNDPVATGLNLLEGFTANTFVFTGAAFACRATGAGPLNGGILSGKLYQADFNNTEQTLYTFAFQSGTIYSGSPLFGITVTGGNRVGISITNSLSGIQKFTVGVFGY